MKKNTIAVLSVVACGILGVTAMARETKPDYSVELAEITVNEFLQYYVGDKEENDRIRNDDFDFDSYFFDYGHYSNWCGGFRQVMMAYNLCYELLDLQNMTESELLFNICSYLRNNLDFDYFVVDGYQEFLVYDDMLPGFEPEVMKLAIEFAEQCRKNVKVETVDSVLTTDYVLTDIHSYDKVSGEICQNAGGVHFVEGVVTLEIQPLQVLSSFSKSDFDDIWKEVEQNPDFTNENQKASAYLQASLKMLLEQKIEPCYAPAISYDLVTYTGNKEPYQGIYQVREVGEENPIELYCGDGKHAPELKLYTAFLDFTL